MKRSSKKIRNWKKRVGPAEKAGLLLLCQELMPSLSPTMTMAETLAISGAQENEAKEALEKLREAVSTLVEQMRLEENAPVIVESPPSWPSVIH